MTHRSREAEIIEAHQELVEHIEEGSGMMRALSAATILVAVVLAGSYVFQLVLPLTGVTSVTVVLTDPGNVAAELGVLLLSLLWLYVGARDYRFSSRMRKEIMAARTKEAELGERVEPSSS